MELYGIRAARRIGSQARTVAVGIWEATHDPQRAAEAARLLIDRKLAPVLTDGMVAAHLLAYNRSNLIAAKHRKFDRRKLVLSASAYEEALSFQLKRLALTEGDLFDLRQQYGAAALRVTETAAMSLEQSLQETLLSTLQQGAGVREGVKALRETFETSGFVPAKDYQLEAIFRTQTQTAYGAGRWNSLQDPAIKDILWGFEFAAIEDDRITEVCRQCNGVVRPKSDPFWQRYWPPNHFSCRSTALEIFDDGTPAGADPTEQPRSGFGINPGLVFQDSLVMA